MGRAARITSIDAVGTVNAALRRFQEEATSALQDLEMEVQRALDWIQHDRKDYWRNQVRRSSERTSEAKLALQQSQTFRRIGDYQPACREEKKMLDAATRRLHESEEKVERVRHWSRAVDHAAKEYKAGIHHLTCWLEAELPQAFIALHRMIAALDAYVSSQPPVSSVVSEPVSSMARAGGADVPMAASGAGTAEVQSAPLEPGPRTAQSEEPVGKEPQP